jgi:hypothetical protein
VTGPRRVLGRLQRVDRVGGASGLATPSWRRCTTQQRVGFGSAGAPVDERAPLDGEAVRVRHRPRRRLVFFDGRVLRRAHGAYACGAGAGRGGLGDFAAQVF